MRSFGRTVQVQREPLTYRDVVVPSPLFQQNIPARPTTSPLAALVYGSSTRTGPLPIDLVGSANSLASLKG